MFEIEQGSELEQVLAKCQRPVSAVCATRQTKYQRKTVNNNNNINPIFFVPFIPWSLVPFMSKCYAHVLRCWLIQQDFCTHRRIALNFLQINTIMSIQYFFCWTVIIIIIYLFIYLFFFFWGGHCTIVESGYQFILLMPLFGNSDLLSWSHLILLVITQNNY